MSWYLGQIHCVVENKTHSGLTKKRDAKALQELGMNSISDTNFFFGNSRIVINTCDYLKHSKFFV